GVSSPRWLVNFGVTLRPLINASKFPTVLAHFNEFPCRPGLARYYVLPSQFMSSLDTPRRSFKLVVGVLIFANEKVLLPQRAAKEHHYPNIWELPWHSRASRCYCP